MMRDWQKIEKIFNEAVCLSMRDRIPYIRVKCGADEVLFNEIRQLLEADNQKEELLDYSAFSLGTRLLENEFNEEFLKKPFAHYRNLKLINRGNPQAVFIGENSSTKQFEILKILPPVHSINSQAVSRLHLEAEIPAAVNHPNIVRINDFGIYDEHYFIAMEYVEGFSIRTLLKNDQINFARVVKITRQIAEGLRTLHTSGITHGDIKPENIILTFKDLIKIIDFGNACVFDSARYPGKQTAGRHNYDKLVVGTPAYMSPEQLQGNPLTPQDDLWSFSAVIYEMLTGNRLFTKETAGEIKIQSLNDGFSLNKNLPGEWQNFFKKCFTSDFAARFDCVCSLLDEFEKLPPPMQSSQIH